MQTNSTKTNVYFRKCNPQIPILFFYLISFFKGRHIYAFSVLIRAASKIHVALKSDQHLQGQNIQSQASLISEAHIYFTRTDWAYASLHHNGLYWDNTYKYSQFRTQHNMGRTSTNKTRPYNTNQHNSTWRNSLPIVPSLWFAYVHYMWKSPGLHSTVNQPTQTHKLHCYSDWCHTSKTAVRFSNRHLESR